MHSSLTINEAAIDPVPGKSPEDLNMHIASYLAGGWQMAFYAVHTTNSGIRGYFIWRARRRAPRSRCPAGRTLGKPAMIGPGHHRLDLHPEEVSQSIRFGLR
jgi:hypothetical protein